MHVLVTGGAGFIGSNFLQLSVPRYPERVFVNVDALTYAGNPNSLHGVAEAANYRFERVDVADAALVAGLFRKYDPELVIHFAAESHVDRSIHSAAEFVRSNVQGTLSLLDAARAHWGSLRGLFHHVSTDEVYGSLQLGGSTRFTEETPYDPSSPYSATKAASDHLVRAYSRTHGLRVKLTNCSNNYGPRQFPEKLVPLMILNALERKPLPVYGRGLNVRDWLYVDDHCEAIWAVIDRGRLGETYNIGGDGELMNLDVVRRLCQVVAEETSTNAEELLGLMKFVQDRPGHDLRYAIDASKVRRECGFAPRETFETGLRKTVRWYLSNQAWVKQVQSGAYREWIAANYAGRDAAVATVRGQHD